MRTWHCFLQQTPPQPNLYMYMYVSPTLQSRLDTCTPIVPVVRHLHRSTHSKPTCCSANTLDAAFSEPATGFDNKVPDRRVRGGKGGGELQLEATGGERLEGAGVLRAAKEEVGKEGGRREGGLEWSHGESGDDLKRRMDIWVLTQNWW